MVASDCGVLEAVWEAQSSMGSLQLYPPRIPLEGLSSLQSLALAKPAPEEASFICMFRDQRRPQESFSQGNYVLHEHSGTLPKSRKNLKSKHSSHCFLQIFLTILVFIKPIFPRRKPYKNFSKNEYKNGVKKVFMHTSHWPVTLAVLITHSLEW